MSTDPPTIGRRAFLLNAGAAGLMLRAGPIFGCAQGAVTVQQADPLEEAFRSPPDSSKVWAYWWWLDGAATRKSITADLQAMKEQGIAGVLLVDAGIGGPDAPKGPLFMSAEWLENFRHAVREAARLGMEMSVNLCSGWNAGGPWVSRDDAIKHLVWKETAIDGPREIDMELPRHVEPPPPTVPAYGMPAVEEDAIDWYRDIAVLACRETRDGVWRLGDIQELTGLLQGDRLRWQVPSGSWKVLRVGYVVRKMGPDGLKQTKLSSSSSPMWEIDPMSADAMDRHFAQTAVKLIETAGPLAGRTLKYTHIDSWEIGQPTWTAKFLEEFTSRRGYSPLPYLPALAHKTVETDEITQRFQWDYRRTIADLIAENYYGRLSRLSHERGLGAHSESGGPFFTHYIDALETLGTNDIPMGEFWSLRGKFVGTPQNFVGNPEETQAVSSAFFLSAEQEVADLTQSFGASVRQAASAAHIYGKPLAQAEAYTNFNADWSEDPYFLKSFGDRAFCFGLTRNLLTFYVSQSSLTDQPGYQWVHVGTHFDRNITWWSKSKAWMTYLARCQHLLRLGLFAADVLYFAGESIPNFVLINRKPVAGFDYDVINAQALLTRAAARDGKVTLPDGMSYRYLVLPEEAAERITPAVLQQMRTLVEGGVTLVGPRPKHSLGLTHYPESQSQVRDLVSALWGARPTAAGARAVGKGRVIWGKPLQEVMEADRLQPDVELRGVPAELELDWIHRRDSERDIYFLANLTEHEAEIVAVFRVAGRAPELWDPVTGVVRELTEFRLEGGRTCVPLRFASKQSWFVVFRKPARAAVSSQARNFPALAEAVRLSGPWQVQFDERRGGPGTVEFENLQDWTQRAEDAIRYYSGTAIYRKSFDVPEATLAAKYLDLGAVKNVAHVRLNGRDLGIVWTAPWRVEVEGIVRATGNQLEIEVVNLWPNRLIGDGRLPKSQRLTRTNVRTYEPRLPADFSCWSDRDCNERKRAGTPPTLLPSGLLGPVRLLSEV